MKTMLTVAAILTAAALTGIFSTTTPMAVYAGGHGDHDDNDDYNGRDGGDESETNTEQEIKQKNVGSGESTNNNCALNSIDAEGTGQGGATVACPIGGLRVVVPVLAP